MLGGIFASFVTFDRFSPLISHTQIPLTVFKTGFCSEDRVPSRARVAKMAVGWSRVFYEDLGAFGSLLYFFHKMVDFSA